MKTVTNFFKNNYIKIITIVVIIILVSLISSSLNNIEVKNINYIKIAGTKIKIELALTPEMQEKGLSGITGIKEDEGMLFVFNKPSKYYFWMKNMNFPIDIIWIDKNMRVVYIEKNVKPDTYPQTFGPDKDSQYVLEVNAMFSEKNNLKENDNVIFLP